MNYPWRWRRAAQVLEARNELTRYAHAVGATLDYPMVVFVVSPYVAGTVIVPGGVVSNLLYLMRNQVQSTTPGSAAELRMEPSPMNTVPMYFGVAGDLAGPVSAANFGFQLAPNSPPRVYQSTFPGSPTPLGMIQVFAAANAALHVEVST